MAGEVGRLIVCRRTILTDNTLRSQEVTITGQRPTKHNGTDGQFFVTKDWFTMLPGHPMFALFSQGSPVARLRTAWE
jgi:hypothetical protein